MLETLQSIALEAGEIALGYFDKNASLAVESKGHLDLVTQADTEIEAFLVGRLKAAFPGDGVLGEEGGGVTGRSGRTWVIDPIDGTFNFVRGSDQWSVSIGLFDGEKPVFGILNLAAQKKLVIGGEGVPAQINGVPMKPLVPFDRSRAAVALGLGPASTDSRGANLVKAVAEAGMLFRYSGCGSVSLLSVALGQVDGYISLAESSWDVMAVLAILNQLGGECTVDWSSVGLQTKFPLMCGSPEFLDIAAKLHPQPA